MLSSSGLKIGAVALLAVSALFACTATAKTFRWADQGDAFSMDPYVRAETLTLGIMGNVYEGLVRRNPQTLEIEPALAERWEMLEPLRWRFYLRKGVKFHDGRPLTADDVVFSAARVRSGASELKTRLANVKDVIKVDDYTVDFTTEVPAPLLFAEWDTWHIFSQSWAKENFATETVDVTKTTPNFASTSANGTGPFILTYREADVRTEFVANPAWWDKAHFQGNVDKVIYTPIKSDPTRVAALVQGQIDMMEPVPPQDLDRINKSGRATVLVKPELRTIFFGMDQTRDELVYSNVKGKNPFKDRRVRLAFYQAIDMEAIKTKVMRGLSVPSAMMIGAGINGFDPSIKRYPFDPETSKKLLAEAGYPNGFEVRLDCSNDRYVNDKDICQAVVGMLARVGVKVNLNAQTKTLIFPYYNAKRDMSFYMLGWTPNGQDALNELFNIEATVTRNSAGNIIRGPFNYGGYTNPKVDALITGITSETNKARRDAMIAEAYKMTLDDISHLPLHQQALAWGVRKNVTLIQRMDNQFDWRTVTLN